MRCENGGFENAGGRSLQQRFPACVRDALQTVVGIVAAVVWRRCDAEFLLFPASFSGGRRGDGGGGCHGDGRRGEN